MTSSDNRRSLVRGRHILLRALDDDSVDVLDDGGILQVDGRIQEIGPFAELASRHQDATVVGSPDHIVIPGLEIGRARLNSSHRSLSRMPSSA